MNKVIIFGLMYAVIGSAYGMKKVENVINREDVLQVKEIILSKLSPEDKSYLEVIFNDEELLSDYVKYLNTPQNDGDIKHLQEIKKFKDFKATSQKISDEVCKNN